MPPRTRLAMPVLLLTVVVIALTACGAVANDPTPAPTAIASPVPTAQATSTPSAPSAANKRVTLDTNGLPSGVIGPLLLYRTVVEDRLSFGVSSPSPEVAVYDVGTGTEILRIWIGNPARLPQASFVAGSHVVVNFGNSVERFSLDGVRDTLFAAPTGTVVTGLAADAATGIAVFAVQPSLGSPVTLHWYDIATATPLREQAPFEFTGPGVPLPRTSGPPSDELLLRGVTYSDEVGGYAALAGDGTVRELATSGLVQPSPSGELIAHGPGRVCGDIGGPLVEITATATNSVVARYSDPSSSLQVWDWSPDGQEVAIHARPLLGDSECPNTAVAPTWLALSRDGAIREVPSNLALRNEWFGDRAITFRCQNQADAGWFSRRDGLQRPSVCLPFDVEIWLGNQLVATEGTATILGFIEVE